jgi:hypothetical protein
VAVLPVVGQWVCLPAARGQSRQRRRRCGGRVLKSFRRAGTNRSEEEEPGDLRTCHATMPICRAGRQPSLPTCVQPCGCGAGLAEGGLRDRVAAYLAERAFDLVYASQGTVFVEE